MTRLLVSVRSVAEAEAALAGGAALIDVKEPAHGSLGQASLATINAVAAAVAGRVPVSAALGELTQRMSLHPLWLGQRLFAPPLAFVKWGLAGLHGRFFRYPLGWTLDLMAKVHPETSGVCVAYADWERAQAPPVEEVCEFARGRQGGAFLIDTCIKTPGTTLLDWLPLRKIALYTKLCQQTGVRVALAGSLGLDQIRLLLPLRPDWIAVRGAACTSGERTASIDSQRVRTLVQLLEAP